MLTHLSSIQSDPLGFLIELMYLIPSILIALTLHELGHAYAAKRCGDPTAEMLGRLSFNPLKHLDPLGTASMFLIGVGWAKPVPVNPRNFRHYRRDDIIVSAAGITVNLCLFILGTLLSVICVKIMCPEDFLRWMPDMQQGMAESIRGQYRGDMPLMVRETVRYLESPPARFLIWTGLYNGDFLEEFLKYFSLNHAWLIYVLRFLGVFCSLNIGLAVFNLLPFPPLDGYRLANELIFRGRWRLTPQVLRVSVVALLVINYATDWLSYALYYAASGVQTALLWILLPLFGMA